MCISSDAKYVGAQLIAKMFKGHSCPAIHMKCYSCDECEMVYASNSALSRHKKWHKGGNLHHRFRCEMCLYSTDSRKDFKRHGFIHSGERPFTCTLCGRGFTRNNHLKRHMLTHSANFPYTCTLCPKTFRRSDHLAVHIQKHQEDGDLSMFVLPAPISSLNESVYPIKQDVET